MVDEIRVAECRSPEVLVQSTVLEKLEVRDSVEVPASLGLPELHEAYEQQQVVLE